MTKILYPKASLIRFPATIRGARQIDFGSGLTTGKDIRLEVWDNKQKGKVITFGKRVEIGDFVHIAAVERVEIGNHVLMASKIFITDLSHGVYSGDGPQSDPATEPRTRPAHTSAVKIEDNVWIGEGVTILQGVTIGKGSIIGSNSVVSRSIPENSIAVGIPAKVIKQYNGTTRQWEKI